ncbi:hypothetical protein, partial [Actinocorallia longicatena]|uniref:hypothetical protein n=1 Tax=Actinocorallia longicatena TaxID=111803 RepID=UPI0031D7AFFB
MRALERLRPTLPAVLRAWGRMLFALAGSQVLLGLLGMGDAAGFAVMPAVFMSLFQPNGTLRTRLAVTTAGTVLAAGLAMLGGLVAGTAWPLIVALGACGFVLGFAPRLGPHAAALQLPLLTTFVYSAANPGAEVGERGIAVLLALPVFLAATALFAPPDGRRPLVLGAARGLGELAGALKAVAAGEPAAGLAEGALVAFRSAAVRVKPAALPFDGSPRARALLLLSGSVPRAVSATLRLERAADPAERAWAANAAAQAAAL